MYKSGCKGLFPLPLRVALRIETAIVFLFLSPRNATRSRNGNKPKCLSEMLQEYISNHKNQTRALLLRTKIKFCGIFLAKQVSEIFLISTGKSIKN